MSQTQNSDVVKRTDKEIGKLSKSPLWVFGWGLVMTSLTFIFNVFIDLSEQNANIAKFNSISHINELDERKMAMTNETLVRVVDGALAADKYFAGQIQSQTDLGGISSDVVNEALRLIAEARGGINAEVAVLSSLHLNDPQLNSHIDGFKTDMDALDGYLANKESICTSILEKKFDVSRAGLDKLKVRDYKKERELEAFATRVQAFGADTTLKKEAADADLQFQNAQLKTFRYKVYLLLPMSAIVGAFAVIVLKRFRKVAQ